MANTEFTGLQLSADDVRQLTGWGDAMVEDYISLVDAINNIQTGGSTSDDALAALQDLVERHVNDDENPHATSLLNLIDTLISEGSLKNGHMLVQENGRWINRHWSDIIEKCCKDLIIIAGSTYDKVLSGKKNIDIGLQLSVSGIQTDYAGLSVVSEPPSGWAGTSISYDGVSRSLGSLSFGNVLWNSDGTKMFQRQGGAPANQLGFVVHEFATPWDLSSWISTSSRIDLPAVSGSASNLGVWWISEDGLTLVSQGWDDLYQYDMSVAWDLTTATHTKTVLNTMTGWNNPRTYAMQAGNASAILTSWNTSNWKTSRWAITDDNDAASLSLQSTVDHEPEWDPYDAVPRGVFLSADGDQLFYFWDDNFHTRHLLTFSVSIPNNLSSTVALTSDDDTGYNYSIDGGFMYWSHDGLKMYEVIGGSTDTAYQYSSSVVGGGVTSLLLHDNEERYRTNGEGAYLKGVTTFNGVDAQAVLPPYATGSEPTTKYDGSLLYNSSVLRPSWYDGTSWKIVSTKGEHDQLRIEFDVLEGEVDVIRLDLDPLLDIQDHSTEPTGMFDRTETSISFDDVTRTFTIARTGASFTYFIIGVMHEITTDLDIIIPDTEGFYYFYLDNDETIKYINTFDLRLITDWSWLGNIYWDATNKERVMLADERHGLTMDSASHAHFHLSLGAQYISGLGLADFDINGSGDVATNAQLSVASGLIRDEDVPHTVPAYGLPANIPVIYRTGATGEWRKKTADDYPLLYSGSGGYTGASGLPAYNEWTGATWQLTELADNSFVLMHFYATNDIDSHVIAILGQNQYSNIAQARDGANTEITNVGTVPYQEWCPIATVIFQVDTSYLNVPKARTRTTDTGNDYIDWRSSAPEAGTPVGDHGTLGGLGDDDHIQYHNDTRGDIRYYPRTEADTTFEPADATILKDADIGVTVQAYSALNAYTTDITYETLDTNGDVGAGAGQLAIGNHNHSGVYEPADATILKDADIGVNVEAYVAKNTAWNKNFGTGAGEVMEGNTPLGSSTFTGLTDTPVNYTGSAGYQVFVNGAGTGLEFIAPSAGAVWGAITGTLSSQTDLQSALDGKEDSFSKNTAFNKNFGTSAGTVAEGDHNHSGVYEPADATILKDADIGVTVQAYDATILVDADIGVNVQAYNANNALTSDITYGTLDANGDVGAGAGQLAIGNHNHSGVYLPVAGKAADSDKLDNLDSTQFLRSDATDYSDKLLYLRQPTVWANGVPTKNLGAPSLAEMALFDEQFNNKTAFYDWTELTFEYTTDGTTWLTDTSVTQAQIEKLLGGDATSNITITNTTWVGYRITIHNDGTYVYLNALYMYASPQGNTSQIHTEVKNNVGVWESLTSSTTEVGGWPAHWYMPIPNVAFRDPATAGGHKTDIRFTFTPTWVNANNIFLYKLQVWGGYPAGKRNIYATDQFQNVTFPAELGASTLKVAGTDIDTLYEPKDATILKDADIGVTVQAYNVNNALTSDITYGTLNANGDVGTGAGQLAIGDHDHTGVYEPADATILKDSDIGVTVEEYVAKNSAWNKSFGTLAGTVAEGNHNHSGVYEPADATILKDADIGVTVQAYDATILVDADIGITIEGYVAKNTAWNKNFGTLAGTVAEGNHNHSGVYEPADATILKDADIGVTVQAYNLNNALTSDITYGTLDANGDVGTGAGQLAIGNHNHSGVYEPADATILKDADIGVNVEAFVAKNTAWNKNFGTTAGTVMEGDTSIPADFTDLSDTPANYTGAGGYTVKVNAGATGLEFVNAGAGGGDIPSGSVMVFHQASAPTGWTQDTTYNDQALRVVSGAGGGGGGANGFVSRLVNSFNTGYYTITTTTMPSHNHGGSNHRHSKFLTSNSSTLVQGWNRGQNLGGTYWTNYAYGTTSEGSNGAHRHAVQHNVLYRNVILASKD